MHSCRVYLFLFAIANFLDETHTRTPLIQGKVFLAFAASRRYRGQHRVTMSMSVGNREYVMWNQPSRSLVPSNPGWIDRHMTWTTMACCGAQSALQQAIKVYAMYGLHKYKPMKCTFPLRYFESIGSRNFWMISDEDDDAVISPCS